VIDPYYVLEQMPWVSILAITAEQNVLLLKEYRHGAGIVGIGLPGGGAEPGEDPAAAARRELLEETGYAIDDLVDLGWCWANWANQDNRVHHFLARDCRRIAPPSPDPTEEIAVESVDLDDLLTRPDLLRNSYHLVTLSLARPLLTNPK
jgi:8-oxo-dGTP pyrophosphatase MutT (NUDIX family)